MKATEELPRYSYYITWSKADREFVATFIELPGLSGLGGTVVEAIRELNDALKGWLEVAEQEQFEVPEPMEYSPFIIFDQSSQGQGLPQGLGRTITTSASPVNTVVRTIDLATQEYGIGLDQCQ